MQWLDRLGEKFFDIGEMILKLLFLPFFIGILLVLAAGIYEAIQDSRSPDLTLKKKDWKCSKEITKTTTFYSNQGSILVPMTSEHKECVLYEHL